MSNIRDFEVWYDADALCNGEFNVSWKICIHLVTQVPGEFLVDWVCGDLSLAGEVIKQC